MLKLKIKVKVKSDAESKKKDILKKLMKDVKDGEGGCGCKDGKGGCMKKDGKGGMSYGSADASALAPYKNAYYKRVKAAQGFARIAKSTGLSS